MRLFARVRHILWKALYLIDFWRYTHQIVENVYAYKNMPTINFGVILKNKMAASIMFQFCSLSFPYPLSLALL